MPTNRPFLSNFLAAFRAHSAIQNSTPSSSSSTTSPSSQSSYTPSTSTSISPNTTSNPRSIATKATSHSNGATTAAMQAAGHLQSTRQSSTSPLARSPGSPSPSGQVGGSASRQRRGSDSSTEGFRDALGTEKWYIGGRTATGEERFYKLGMAKRHRSIDRLSLDRLSL